MPLIGFTDRLDSIEENLLYKAQDGSYWLSGVSTFHQDAKGCTIVVQSVSKERYAAGEKGPQVGLWREIGSKDKPPARGRQRLRPGEIQGRCHAAQGDGRRQIPARSGGTLPLAASRFRRDFRNATRAAVRHPARLPRGNSDFERGSPLHALRAAKAARRGQMKPGGLGL